MRVYVQGSNLSSPHIGFQKALWIKFAVLLSCFQRDNQPHSAGIPDADTEDLRASVSPVCAA